MGAEMRRKERFEHLVRAFVLATGGQPVRGLGKLLPLIREKVPDVTAKEWRTRCAGNPGSSDGRIA